MPSESASRRHIPANGDFFDLDQKVEHDSLRGAEQVFDLCESVAKYYAQTDTEINRGYLQGDPIKFPISQDREGRHYQLERVEIPGGTSFIFQRVDEGFARTGFTVDRQDFGPALLSPRTTEDRTPIDDDGRKRMLKEAQKRIEGYIGDLDIDRRNLEAIGNDEIVPMAIAQKLGRTIIRPFTSSYFVRRGEIKRSRSYDPINNDEQAKLVRRHASLPRIAALAALLPLPFISSSVEVGGVSMPKPVVIELIDDTINQSEHRREGFDKLGLQLPFNEANVLTAGSKPQIMRETPTLSDEVREKLSSAPMLDAQTDSTQDLHGGPRRIANLASDDGFSEEFFSDDEPDLDVDECEEIPVEIANGEQLIVTNISQNLAKRLSFEIDGRGIVVCNVSSEVLLESQLDELYVQVRTSE